MSYRDTLFRPTAIDDEIHFHTLRADGTENCLGVLEREDVNPLIIALYQAKQATTDGEDDE